MGLPITYSSIDVFKVDAEPALEAMNDALFSSLNPTPLYSFSDVVLNANGSNDLDIDLEGLASETDWVVVRMDGFMESPELTDLLGEPVVIPTQEWFAFVPEPSTALLALVGLVTLLRRRR
jgi:hypothetical protein